MRKEFIRRQNNRRAARRKAKEEKKYGVKTTMQLYGRMEQESLHEGDFDARQAKSLQSHIHYPEEFKRERAEEERWLAESMDFFKNWIYPLRKVFSNYSRDFMPLRTKTIDFDELQKLRSGLTISDWMIFVNDFELMPWQVTKTQALAIFHYSNLKLGAMNTDLGARRGAQIISFEEYISCLRGVAMGEGFRSLPTSNERINALGSYMRRQAYVKGKNNKVMERRMGNAKIWEKRGFLPLPSSTERVDCPMVEYKFTVPKVLALDESVTIAMEMVDHIVAHAIQRHILTLVRLPLERTVIEPPEAWDGGSTEIKLSKEMENLINSGKPKNIPEQKGKSKVGFGSGFTPTRKTLAQTRREETMKEKYKNRSPLKFGEDAIQKLPLHQLRAARASVEVIRILVNDIFNGSAKQRLLQIYQQPATSDVQGWVQAIRKDGIDDDQFAGFSKRLKERKVFIRRRLPKDKTVPYEYKKLVEEKQRLAKEKKRQRKRQQRQNELKKMLELQRKAYEQKKAQEKQRKKEEKRELRRKKKEEEERLAKITAKQKADVKNWLANGGKRGAGKRKTHEELAAEEKEEAKKRRAAEAKKKRLEKFKLEKEKKNAEVAKSDEAARVKAEAEERARVKALEIEEERKKKEEEDKKKEAEAEKAKESGDDNNNAEENTETNDDGGGGEEENGGIKIDGQGGGD